MNPIDEALQKLCFEIKDRFEGLVNGAECDGVGLSLTYSDTISNMHYAPFNGELNPSRDPSLPLYYPGWEGILHLRARERFTAGTSNLLPTVGINAYGGGSSIRSHPWANVQNAIYFTSYRKQVYGKPTRDELEVYSYQVKLFKDDYSTIWNEFNQAIVLDTLKHGNSPFRYEYVYTNPAVRAKDSEIMQKHARLKTITRI